MTALDPRDRTTILIHYYRAMVGRADIWRMRMDATSNWAIGVPAAIISFSLVNAQIPHYVVFVAVFLTLLFLTLEARRLSFYNLFQQRVLLLEQGLIRPALTGQEAGPDFDLADALDGHLGRTVPSMPFAKAAARRLRRVYLYLFVVQLIAWLFKLANHPQPAASFGAVIERAAIGAVPGAAVFGVTLAALLAAALLALVRGGIDRSKPGAEDPA